jgi:hypothetical protein
MAISRAVSALERGPESLAMIIHHCNLKCESQRASLATYKENFISGSWRAEKTKNEARI